MRVPCRGVGSRVYISSRPRARPHDPMEDTVYIGLGTLLLIIILILLFA